MSFRRASSWLTVFLTLALCCSQARPAPGWTREGQWSRQSISPWPDDAVMGPTPDGDRTIPSTRLGLELVLSVQGDLLRWFRASDQDAVGEESLMALAEVSASPDGKILAITSSDGGWVGTWSAHLQVWREGQWQRVDLSRPVRQRFARLMRQRDADALNVAVLGLSASRRVWLLAEVPCSSSYRRMCTQAVYEADAQTGQVVRRLPPAQARQRIQASGGPRLSGAKPI